jgi:ATP-dependent RNA helicase DHX57
MILFLHRYGYERQSCIEALQVNDDDTGAAYEYLFTQCFHSNQNNVEESEVTSMEQILKENGMTIDEVLEQRNEEIDVLKSIYEDGFTEKLANRSWTLKFECDTLRDLVFKPEKSDQAQLTSTKSLEICKFNLKGACRFGSRCKYVHDIPNKNVQEVDARHLKQEVDKHFELDLRFVKDNMYPLEPPIIGFSALDSNFPPYISLNITEHMYKEAKMLSESQSPIMYSLVSLLEDEVLLRDLVDKMPMQSSLPQFANQSLKKSQNNENDVEVQKLISSENNDNVESEIYEKETEAMVRMVDSEVKDDTEVKVEIKRSTSRESDNMNTRNPAEVLKQNRRLKDDFVRKQVI